MNVPIFRFIEGVKTQVGSVNISDLAIAMAHFDVEKARELGINTELYSYSFIGQPANIIEIIEES